MASLIARTEQCLGAEDPAIHRRWLDGALQKEIAAELDITRDVVHERLVRIERLLHEGDGDTPSVG